MMRLVIEMWDPVFDLAAATAVRSALDRVGYSEAGISELLGEDAFETDAEHVPVHDRRLPRTPLATAVRSLFLGMRVGVSAAAKALGRDAVEALEAIGFVGVEGDELVSRCRIFPVHGLLLASDRYAQGPDEAAGWVASYTPTAHVLHCLTPRPRVRRALDVGTGSGIHALLAARHSTEVVATDLNLRAVAFTRLNAALNGIDNVDVRLGSLFEPVEGERFDLITCNAPFVVSPETKFVYRDGGLPADELSHQVVAGAAAHLGDGGYASLLISWVSETEDDPDERPFAWVDRSGCDAWILGFHGAEPLDHAAAWNDELMTDPARFAGTLDEWTSYLDELGVGWVTEGALLLHRRAGDEHRMRADAVDPDELEPAAGQVLRAFAGLARLAAEDLLDQRPKLSDDVRFEHELAVRDGRPEPVETRIRLAVGTNDVWEVQPGEAEVVAALDGQKTVREALRGRRRAAALVEDLLETGFLELP